MFLPYDSSNKQHRTWKPHREFSAMRLGPMIAIGTGISLTVYGAYKLGQQIIISKRKEIR